MLVPKRVKHRREFRGKMRGEAKGGKEVSFGEYGLQATTSHWITNRQIEAARIAMTRYMKRGGKVWIKIFPHKSYTAKAIGVPLRPDKNKTVCPIRQAGENQHPPQQTHRWGGFLFSGEDIFQYQTYF